MVVETRHSQKLETFSRTQAHYLQRHTQTPTVGILYRLFTRTHTHSFPHRHTHTHTQVVGEITVVERRLNRIPAQRGTATSPCGILQGRHRRRWRATGHRRRVTAPLTTQLSVWTEMKKIIRKKERERERGRERERRGLENATHCIKGFTLPW